MPQVYEGALGTTVTVIPVDSTVSVGFRSVIALIGEADGGEAPTEEPVPIDSARDAAEQFGEGSELADNLTRALRAGATSVFGVATDDDWEAAAEAAMDVAPRYVTPVTDTEGNIIEVHSVVEDRANILEFARVIAPTPSSIAPTEVNGAEPIAASDRLVEVAPKEFEDGTYVASALVGHASRQALGSSITYDELTFSGDLATEYRRDIAQNFERIAAVTKDGTITEGVTTSDEDAFADLFQVEIVDAVALGADEIAQNYAGQRPNTREARRALARDVRSFLSPLTSRRPPLLSDADGGPPFAVEASAESDDTVNLRVSISPVNVMKQIDIDLEVGSAVTFSGADT